MRRLYLLLAVLGLVLPYYFLIISSVVFWLFVYQESARYRIPNAWLFVLANLFVGVSFALPMFLFFRQARLETMGAAAAFK